MRYLSTYCYVLTAWMHFHKTLVLIYPKVVVSSHENEKLTFHQGFERGLRKQSAENQRRFPEIRLWVLNNPDMPHSFWKVLLTLDLNCRAIHFTLLLSLQI